MKRSAWTATSNALVGFGGSVGPPFIEASRASPLSADRVRFGGSVGPPFIEAPLAR